MWKISVPIEFVASMSSTLRKKQVESKHLKVVLKSAGCLRAILFEILNRGDIEHLSCFYFYTILFVSGVKIYSSYLTV